MKDGRAEISEEVKRQLAQRRFSEAAVEFTNTVYEQPDSLQPVVDKLNQLIREAVKSPAYDTLVRTTFAMPFPGSPEELASFQASESKKWGEIVNTAGMKEP